MSQPLLPDGTPSADGWTSVGDFTTQPAAADGQTGGSSTNPAKEFTLYASHAYPEKTRLLRVPARSALTPTCRDESESGRAGAEIFLVRGAVTVQQTDGVAVWKLTERSWLRLPAVLACVSITNLGDSDAFVYLKENHLPNEAVA